MTVLLDKHGFQELRSVLGYYATRTVHGQLLNIQEASKVTPCNTPPDVLSQQTEDALKLETLGQLAQSANKDIRAASVKILAQRIFQDGAAWRLMLSDISGSDATRRDRALACLRFLLPTSRRDDENDPFLSVESFTAIINCLCKLMPEAYTAERGSASDSPYRLQAERDALNILVWITPCNVENALQAGLISRWLANYPFGGPDAPLSRKRDVLIEIHDGKSCYIDEDFGDAMQMIVDIVFREDVQRRDMVKVSLLLDHALSHNVLRKEVVKAGLIIDDAISRRLAYGWEKGAHAEAWNRIPEGAVRIDGGWSTGSQEILDDSSTADYLFGDIPEGAVRTSGGYTLNGGPRRREESIEERALRRRRREAVVVGRDGQAIAHQDIIQRAPNNEQEQIIRDPVEPLMADIAEAQSTNQPSWLRWLSRLRPDGLAPVF